MILLSDESIAERRAVADGPLRGLTDSLARDLAVAIERPLFIPEEKARLTRAGGRCAEDGSYLDFDPYAPRQHRCRTCGKVYDGEEHYRWWVMGYQLWLAERAVHASTLYLLRGDARAGAFARSVLDGYTLLYARYPNADNVLGPTRPFFSTYLESIWLLQLCVAASALDAVDGSSAITERLRDELIGPSAKLIRSYDEGASNRQVWNAAAMAAAGAVLNDRLLLSYALSGPAGITAHLEHGLLADGTWYEGENYHLFAHRGLWYGVTIAARVGVDIDVALLARFEEGNATTFLTALPDLTFPARRDSQHGVSLRQWRFAELAELGLARRPDDRRLKSALHELYDPNVPRTETDRWRATAEAERNVPASGLTREDLGWRSLLFALPALPELAREPRTSAILPAQGFAVFRRDGGRVYVGVDYGHSGGGHGHPDRLNLLLACRDARWLDDMGTGSYVDPRLHWYRSTLAHNAPAINGHSQRRVDGMLLSWDERGGVGWMEARLDDAALGVGVLRTIVVCPDYLVDRLIWWGAPDTQIDLPLHVDGEVEGARWTTADPGGSHYPEDGYGWLRDAERLDGNHGRELLLRCVAASGAQADCFVALPEQGAPGLWRATAPGPPREGGRDARFHFARAVGPRGAIVTVWSWRGVVNSVSANSEAVVVQLAGEAEHRHERTPHGWRVGFKWKDARSSIELTGQVEGSPLFVPEAEPEPRAAPFDVPVASDADFDSGQPIPALEFELEGQHYRRSELGWHEAGQPRALVAVMATPTRLIVELAVQKEPLAFAPRREDNDLDNEHPDTNSDGVQLYVRPRDARGSAGPTAVFILVPEPDGAVRITPRTVSAEAIPVSARWRPAPGGWEMRCAIPLLPATAAGQFDLDVIVNETSPDRERRRGQLVLSGGAGEYTYLRGDRQPDERLLSFRLARA